MTQRQGWDVYYFDEEQIRFLGSVWASSAEEARAVMAAAKRLQPGDLKASPVSRLRPQAEFFPPDDQALLDRIEHEQIIVRAYREIPGREVISKRCLLAIRDYRQQVERGAREEGIREGEKRAREDAYDAEPSEIEEAQQASYEAGIAIGEKQERKRWRCSDCNVSYDDHPKERFGNDDFRAPVRETLDGDGAPIVTVCGEWIRKED